MDAKPQRAFRATNENMAPTTTFAGKNQLRQKSAGMAILKDTVGTNAPAPAKRAAFGDLSNTARARTEAVTGHGNKVYPYTVTKSGLVSSAPMPAASSVKTAFVAPAQRARASFAPQDAEATRRLSTLPRKPAVYHDAEASRGSNVSRNEVPAIPNSLCAAIKKSPRHSKSQPCLKNAAGFPQQKKSLRRTMSRLPVEKYAFKEDALLAGLPVASLSAVASSEELPIEEDECIVDADIPETTGSDAQQPEAQAVDGQFVDALEEAAFDEASPLGGDDTEDDFGRLREEIDTVSAQVDEAVHAIHLANENSAAIAAMSSASESGVDLSQSEFLSEAPASTLPSVISEEQEHWDEDGDYYEDAAYTTAHSFRSMGDNTTGALTTVLMPRITARVQEELAIAKQVVEKSITQEDIDDELWDISMVAEYGDDINDYMREMELKMLPNAHYMDMQTEIQWSMRSVLMEWLIQVHSRFNLLPETLFLAVNYVDRFLSSKIVSVAKLQLVGATAIFIASKYEEIICPSIQEIVYMVDHGYSTDEILKAERFMLSMLNFELGWPGPMSFLRRISKADDYDVDTRTLAKYFLEVTIMDEQFVACAPSFLAAGSHCLARLMLMKGDWGMSHTYYSGYTWSQVRPLAVAILGCCMNPTKHHAAVYEKYASSKFKKSAVYVAGQVESGFRVPELNASILGSQPNMDQYSIYGNHVESGVRIPGHA